MGSSSQLRRHGTTLARVATSDTDAGPTTEASRPALRANAFGRFRDLLGISAKSPAMLHCLNQTDSTRVEPNENYSREVLELHNLSVDGPYTQSDVETLARILTGWTEQGGQCFFDAADHDEQEKTFLTRALVTETGRVMVNDVSVLAPIVNQSYSPANGATYPGSTFGRQMMQTARLIKAGVGLEVCTLSIGGWDNHPDERSSTGRVANRLADFGNALAAFYRDMATGMNDVIVLTMSEFGRTSVENGSFGADHAHATTCAQILGEAVSLFA